MNFIKNFITFGLIQLKSITFGICLIVGFIISRNMTDRYDFLFIYAIIIQIILYKVKFESKRDIIIVTVFHLIGLTMEIIEVSLNHSWSYNSTGYLFILGVPIFTGFMYASVGSYMAKSFDEFQLKFENMPNSKSLLFLSILIYSNFILNNHIHDFRFLIYIVIIILFYKTKVFFTINNTIYKMHLILSYILIGFFIWIAENLATFLNIWSYPYQQDTWQLVHLSKISSWALLCIVSFNLIYIFKNKSNN